MLAKHQAFSIVFDGEVHLRDDSSVVVRGFGGTKGTKRMKYKPTIGRFLDETYIDCLEMKVFTKNVH